MIAVNQTRQELLSLNDKLFVVAIVAQLAVMLFVFSGAFGFYVWNTQRDASAKISSNFEEWEPRLTEAIYLNGITKSWEMNELPVLKDFADSLLINGFPSSVSVAECQSSDDLSHVQYSLTLGELKLPQCVFIKRKPSEIFAAAYWTAGLALISVVLTALIWVMVRRRYKSRLLEPLIGNMEKEAKDAAVGKMASQIAHDIRSPLAALRILMRDTYGLQEEKRMLLQSAVNRIQDIANNLLPSKKDPGLKKESTSIELISSLLESLVSEKRLQYRDLISLQIQMELSDDSYSAFAEIIPSQLSRSISNLIDNSVEALESRAGQVLVRLSNLGSKRIRVEVEDNGKGIPSKLLGEVTKEKVSIGKEGGSGLGLHFVSQYMQKIGGSLRIESEENKGTKIVLEFHRAQTPNWFARSINVQKGMRVAIIDDDAAIHKIWEGRFKSIRAHEENVRLEHFASPEEFDGGSEGDFDLYLVDYEFVGSSTNGLQWILAKGIEKSSILVTSRFEEVQIRHQCDSQNLKLIPKLLSAYIPIEWQSRQGIVNLSLFF